MKNRTQPAPSRLFQPLAQVKCLLTACFLSLALPFLSQAQSTWIGGTSTDWNTAANWSAGVPNGVNAIVNTNAPALCKISATISATPVDILVGSVSSANTGRVD